jgi:hypothetical protein
MEGSNGCGIKSTIKFKNPTTNTRDTGKNSTDSNSKYVSTPNPYKII